MALLRQTTRSALRIYQASCFSFRNKSEKKLTEYIEQRDSTLERKELLARAAGDDDPFGMKILKKGPGTEDQPNLIPSYLDKRIVGCICEEDSPAINWMWVHKDELKRCECGHWFKLVEAKPF